MKEYENEENGHPSEGCSRTYHFYHDMNGTAKLSTTVVHALADVLETDVTDAGFTLYDSLDPDGLDIIFDPLQDGSLRPNAHVAFTILGCGVTVYSDGEIVITAPAHTFSTEADTPRQ